MTSVFGISGKARSGKNTVASIILDRVPGKLIGFADPIRKFVGHDLCGFDYETTLEAQKEVPQDVLAGRTPRYAMQTLGTEWGRNTISNDLWIKACLKLAAKLVVGGESAIIGDVRFENEAQAIRDIGGVVIHVRRPGAPAVDNATHASEAGISICTTGDILIENDGSLEELYEKVWKALGPLYESACEPAVTSGYAVCDSVDETLRELPEPEPQAVAA